MNLNNYHWTETNISSILKSKIKKELHKLDYKEEELEVQGQLFNRMNKQKINYFITLRAKKEGNEIIMKDFDPFSSIDDIKCNNSDDKLYFYNFIKSLENDLQKEEIKKEKENNPFLIYKFNLKKEDFINFLFNPSFIRKYFPSFYADNLYFYGMFTIKELVIKENEVCFFIKKDDDFIKCKFVMDDLLILNVFMERRNEFIGLFDEWFTKMKNTFNFEFERKN